MATVAMAIFITLFGLVALGYWKPPVLEVTAIALNMLVGWFNDVGE